MSDFSGLIQGLTIWALPMIFAVTLHEAAHGYAAYLLGDDTAKRMGRLSLNPLRHVDPVGTILMPALLLFAGGVMFGWAKPVPINFNRLRGQRLGMVIVAVAGPGSNVAMAAVAALAMHLLPIVPSAGAEWLFATLKAAVFLNALLAVFNMIPIPPLDGGRVAVGLLPLPMARKWARLENVGLLIVMAGLFLLPMLGRMLRMDLDVFSRLVDGPVNWLAMVIFTIFGP